MAYRLFRNDELRRYSEAFDLAARYVCLAAKAYDYETNLDPTDPGSARDLLAAVVGVVAGFGAVGVRELISLGQWAFWGSRGDILASLPGVGSWRILLVPCIGGLFVGPLVWFLARDASGHGVPEVMEAIFHGGGRIRPIVAGIKAVASALSIGSGGSVGREGPIIQIGSSLGSTVGQFFNVSNTRMKTLVG